MSSSVKKDNILLQVSFKAEPPRSTRYTDDMFPLDDLEIIQGYSLDAMAFGERTVEKISPSMAESYEMVEKTMCGPEKTKKKEKKEVPPKEESMSSSTDSENIPPQKGKEDEDQGVLQNLVSMGFSFYAWITPSV